MDQLAGKVMLGAASKTDACRWYRMAVPMNAINDDRLVWAEDFNDAAGVTRLRWDALFSLDALIFQRPVSDSVLAVAEALVNKAGSRPRVVVELDDDLWSIPTHNPAYAYYRDAGRLKNLSRMVAIADRVIVSTSHLADAVRSHAHPREVVVVPNTLPSDFPWATGAPDRRVVFSGGATHGRDVEHAFRSIRTILKPDRISAHVIGHDHTSVLKGATFHPWSKDVSLHYQRLTKFSGSLGLAPLKLDTFNLAKSNIRLLEYAACGLISLATPYGPYEESPAVGVGENELWKHVVRRVLALPDATKRELQRIQQAWANKFVITDHVDQWKDAWYL